MLLKKPLVFSKISAAPGVKISGSRLESRVIELLSGYPQLVQADSPLLMPLVASASGRTPGVVENYT